MTRLPSRDIQNGESLLVITEYIVVDCQNKNQDQLKKF